VLLERNTISRDGERDANNHKSGQHYTADTKS